jgi:O-antigen/teichoic acid export membrane protein
MTLSSLKEKSIAALKWSEQYTKTDMVYLVKGGFWLGLSQSTSSLCAFILSIIFANLLPKESFGIYKYVLSVFSILMIPSLNGIFTSLNRSVAMGNEGDLKDGLKTQIKWSLLGSALSIILSLYYFFHHNQILFFCFLIVAAFLPIFSNFNIYNSLLSGRKNFRLSSLFSISELVFSSLVIIISLLFTKNPVLIVFAYFASYSFIRVILLFRVLKKYPPNENKDPEMISYGKHLTAMRIIGEIYKYLDKVLVFHYIGAIELAVYTIATSAPAQINNLISQVGVLAFPKYAQSNKEQAKKTLKSKIILLGLLSVIAFIIYIIIAPIAFRLLFPKYLDSVIYSQIFAISLLAIPSIIPSTILYAQKETKKLYKANIFMPIINIIILFVSIQFGLIGIIIGKIINSFLDFIILTFLAKSI